MKSILNFRHNIEKYGFFGLEFGNPHPCAAQDLVPDHRHPVLGCVGRSTCVFGQTEAAEAAALCTPSVKVIYLWK